MSDQPPILTLNNVRKIYLERVILRDVSLAVHPGERVALTGANGAGKSTLLGIVGGWVTPDGGEVRMRRGLEVAALRQDGGLQEEWTIREALESAFRHLRDAARELEEVHHALENPHDDETAARLLARQGELSHMLERHDYHALDARMEEARCRLGVPEYERRVAHLSGGERRRTSLCRTLLSDAELLLLDEPTNHLDAETLDWLEEFLAAFRGTVMLVTHDRYFLDRVATRLIEVFRGEARDYPGNYTAYLEAKAAEEEQAARREASRRILLRREMDWLRRQPKARTTKAKARIDRVHDLAASRPLPPDGSMQLLIPSGPRLGKTLIEIENLGYSIAGVPLIRDFTFTLGPGDRVGVVGRNGLGKTTLMRLLLGELQPQQGTIKIGQSVKFVYADQARANLDPEKTVLEEVAGDLEFVQVGGERLNFRSWLSRFLFDDSTAAMPIRLVSGGERNRVQLAKMLREGGNVVILDEPTNDLDLPTLRVMEEALVNFEGCAFVVSHDRYFLNRVVNRVIGFRGDGRVVTVEGNYDHYRLYMEREEEAAEQKAPATKTPPRETKGPTEPGRKLGFNEQREFDAMEESILAAETRAEELHRTVEEKAADASAAAEVARLVKELESVKSEVERLYARWAELSERAR